MKFYTILFLSLFVSTCLLSASPLVQPLYDSTLITIKVEGLPEGKVARLVGTYCDQNYIADTAIVAAGGMITLKREHPLAEGWYYWLLPNQTNFQMLVDKNQHFSLETKSNDLIGSMKVTGSLENELFFKNAKFEVGIQPRANASAAKMKSLLPTSPDYAAAKKEQDDIIKERKEHLDEFVKKYPNAFFTKFKTSGQNPDIIDFRKPNGDLDTLKQLNDYRSRMFDNVDFNDTRLLHTPVVFNKLKRTMAELTPQNPDSLIVVADFLIGKAKPYKEYFKFFVNWIALNYENTKTNVMDGEAVYVHIIQKYITKDLAFWADQKTIDGLQKHAWEMESSLLGRKGPDVKALNEKGEMKSIYEIKAPWVIIYMFNPDCEHCREQTPKLIKFMDTWRSKGVEVVTIGVNTTDAEWKEYIAKNKMPFINIFDPTNRAIYAKYFVDITPELYLLNPDHIIVGKNLKVEQLEEYIPRMMLKYEKKK